MQSVLFINLLYNKSCSIKSASHNASTWIRPTCRGDSSRSHSRHVETCTRRDVHVETHTRVTAWCLWTGDWRTWRWFNLPRAPAPGGPEAGWVLCWASAHSPAPPPSPQVPAQMEGPGRQVQLGPWTVSLSDLRKYIYVYTICIKLNDRCVKWFLLNRCFMFVWATSNKTVLVVVVTSRFFPLCWHCKCVWHQNYH